MLICYVRSLSKTRRKRAVPEDWATAETIQAFKPGKSSKAQHAGARAIAVDASGDLALFGGADGDVTVYSISKAKVMHHVQAGAAVTDVLWTGKKAVVSTAAGEVKGFNGKKVAFSFAGHAGEATALALHPCGEILASVGVDKSYIFYELSTPSQILQLSTNTGMYSSKPCSAIMLMKLIRINDGAIPPGRTPLCCGRGGRPDQALRRQDRRERGRL